MNKEYVHVTVNQISDNVFDIKVKGNFEDLLKSLAGAVTQVITSAPESHQQICRTRFLGYLNQATVEEHLKEL